MLKLNLKKKIKDGKFFEQDQAYACTEEIHTLPQSILGNFL